MVQVEFQLQYQLLINSKQQMIRIINFRPFVPLTWQSVRRFGLFRFPLPDLGEKIKQGRVKKLYVKEGDRVSEFQKLADVESDKQFTEITAPEEGIIKKLYYMEDQTCQVGDIFLDIETKSTHTDPIPPKSEKKPEVAKPELAKQVQEPKKEVLASATVKMWARQHKINLEDVVGTGKNGRILKGDVIHFIEKRKDRPIQGRVVKQQTIMVPKEVTKHRMSESQVLMQKLVTYSSSIPHLFLQESFDVTSLVSMVQQAKQRKQHISLLSVIIKAFSLALSEHPRINSVYNLNQQFDFGISQQQNLLLPNYNIKGLSFSLINDLQKESIIGIQKRLDARVNTETSSEDIRKAISGATICLSNIGQAEAMTLNPPIVGQMICHASVGQVRDIAVSSKGKLERRQFTNVVLGGDHRVVDGASCARFLMTWKAYTENPTSAFLSMI